MYYVGKVPHSGIWGHRFVSVLEIRHIDDVSLQSFRHSDYCAGRYVASERKGKAPVTDSQRSHTTKAMTHEREEVLNQTNNINKNKFISFQEDV